MPGECVNSDISGEIKYYKNRKDRKIKTQNKEKETLLCTHCRPQPKGDKKKKTKITETGLGIDGT